jgi:hypothetical protein
MYLLKVPVTEALDPMAPRSAQLWFCMAVIAVSNYTTVLAILDCVSVKYVSIQFF